MKTLFKSYFMGFIILILPLVAQAQALTVELLKEGSFSGNYQSEQGRKLVYFKDEQSLINYFPNELSFPDFTNLNINFNTHKLLLIMLEKQGSSASKIRLGQVENVVDSNNSSINYTQQTIYYRYLDSSCASDAVVHRTYMLLKISKPTNMEMFRLIEKKEVAKCTL